MTTREDIRLILAKIQEIPKKNEKRFKVEIQLLSWIEDIIAYFTFGKAYIDNVYFDQDEESQFTDDMIKALKSLQEALNLKWQPSTSDDNVQCCSIKDHLNAEQQWAKERTEYKGKIYDLEWSNQNHREANDALTKEIDEVGDRLSERTEEVRQLEKKINAGSFFVNEVAMWKKMYEEAKVCNESLLRTSEKQAKEIEEWKRGASSLAQALTKGVRLCDINLTSSQ